MNIVDTSNKSMEMAESPGGLSRRAALKTATVAGAAAAAGMSAVLADAPAAGFGAPLVEMSFPVGVLTLDQKAAMIKSVTDVVRGAMNSRWSMFTPARSRAISRSACVRHA